MSGLWPSVCSGHAAMTHSKVAQLADDCRRTYQAARTAADEMLTFSSGSPAYDSAVNTWRSAVEAEERAKKELIAHAVIFGAL